MREQRHETVGTLVAEAARVLQAGGLVAFPTETVYGLGADATNVQALARLFAVKGRPRAHPLIVHLGERSWLHAWAADVPPGAWRLADVFWPGPLTMILRRSALVPDAVTGGQETVGLRVPGHPMAHGLLMAFGGGIAAPSANRFGRVSPTTAAHVRADLGGDVDLILDGGPSEVGIESTIVDLSGEMPRLLRPGRITTRDLERVLHQRVRAGVDASAPRAPGTLDTHYAPRLPLELVEGPRLARCLGEAAGRAAVLAFERPGTEVHVFVQAPRDPSSYARRLYATLREFDTSGALRILVEAPEPDDPEWAGVLDRLRRAASPNARS